MDDAFETVMDTLYERDGRSLSVKEGMGIHWRYGFWKGLINPTFQFEWWVATVREVKTLKPGDVGKRRPLSPHTYSVSRGMEVCYSHN